jgi:hypothetical protein
MILYLKLKGGTELNAKVISIANQKGVVGKIIYDKLKLVFYKVS